MKKSIVILLISIIFFTCKKSTQSPSTEVKIIGKWYLNTTKSWRYTNGVMGTITESSHPDTGSYIQFINNDTGNNSIGSSGSYTIKPFTYLMNEKAITLTYNTGVETDSIKTFTSSNLTLRNEHPFSFGGTNYIDVYDYYYGK